MTHDNLVIRTMTRDELNLVIDWAAAEGWNPGLHDAEAYFATDPGGYFIGLLDGEPAGSVSVVRYGAGFAFLGFFIVRPDLRGQGYGLGLWLNAIETLHTTTTGLDGVLAQTANYARSGFEGAYHNLRYQAVATPMAEVDPQILPYTPAHLNALERYDRQCFPAPRHAFLEAWLRQPDAPVLLYHDGGALTGYGMIRPARDGYRIGPLFADDPSTAEALFNALVSRVPLATNVYIDIPQPNANAMALVRTHRMAPTFETARMYRGPAPQIALDKVFGVTTLELG